MGFGNHLGKGGGDVIRIEKTKGGSDIDVKDCFFTGRIEPTCNEAQNLKVEFYEAQPNKLRVQIRRPVKSFNSDDFAIREDFNDVIYSYTESDFPEKHKEKFGWVKIDFKAGSGGGADRSSLGDGSFMPHEHGLALIWTVVCDSLILIVRNLKRFRWFEIHAWTFFALGIASGILTRQAKTFKLVQQNQRVLQHRDLTSEEASFVLAWANKDLHGTVGQIANILVYIMMAQGILMRFMIAISKRKSFHFVNSFDLTVSRRLHAIVGFIIWLMIKFTLFSGAGLHSMMFGSTLYFIVMGESILAFILMLIFEGIQLSGRVYWKTPLAVVPSKKGDYTQLLESIRSKSNSLDMYP